MKTIGIILIVAGLVMVIFDGINIPVKKKVVEIGTLEVTKTENKHIRWPTYAAGVLVAVGLIGVLASRKKA